MSPERVGYLTQKMLLEENKPKPVQINLKHVEQQLLNSDLIIKIFDYLDAKDIVSWGETCKWIYLQSRKNIVWKNQFTFKVPFVLESIVKKLEKEAKKVFIDFYKTIKETREIILIGDDLYSILDGKITKFSESQENFYVQSFHKITSSMNHESHFVLYTNPASLNLILSKKSRTKPSKGWEILHEIQENNPISSVKISSKSHVATTLVFGNTKGDVKIYVLDSETNKLEKIHEDTSNQSVVHCIDTQTFENYHYVFVSFENGKIKNYCFKLSSKEGEKEEILTQTLENSSEASPVTSLYFDPKRKILYSHSKSSDVVNRYQISLFEKNKALSLSFKRLIAFTITGFQIEIIKMDNEHHWLFLGGEGGRILIFKLEAGKTTLCYDQSPNIPYKKGNLENIVIDDFFFKEKPFTSDGSGDLFVSQRGLLPFSISISKDRNDAFKFIPKTATTNNISKISFY